MKPRRFGRVFYEVLWDHSSRNEGRTWWSRAAQKWIALTDPEYVDGASRYRFLRSAKKANRLARGMGGGAILLRWAMRKGQRRLTEWQFGERR